MASEDIAKTAVITSLDFQELAANQESDPRFVEITSNPSLRFEYLSLITYGSKIYCDVSIGKPKFLVRNHTAERSPITSTPKHSFNNQTEYRLFHLNNLHYDIRLWVKHCFTCQASKVHKQTLSQRSSFLLPDDCFRHIHVNIVGLLLPCKPFHTHSNMY